MAVNIQLKDFATKAVPVLADIIYAANSADSFNEVQCTIEDIINAYPALTSIGSLVTSANKLIYATALDTYAILTLGTGLSITAGTLNSIGSGLTTTTIAGTTQAAAVGNSYIVGNAAQTTITLPPTFAAGDIVKIKGFGAGGWMLAANTGDVIDLGTSTTSAGGSLTSAASTDTIQLSGLVANTTWSVDYVLSSGLTVA